MSELVQEKWAAFNEALKVNSHVQPWNMVVCGPDGASPKGLVAVVWGYSPEGVQRRARLIAAAPDLLKALEGLLNSADPDDGAYYVPSSESMEDARAAIARAKGEAK